MPFKIAFATAPPAQGDVSQAQRYRQVSQFAGHLAARNAGYCGDIAHNPDGSPYLPGERDTCISISHCGNTVIVSADSRLHGIDIEHISNVRGSVLRHFYSPGEQHYVSYMPDTASRQTAFYTLWTRREALAKAARVSVFSLRGIELCPAQVLCDYLRFAGKGWHFASLVHDGYAISVCCDTPIDGIELNFPD